MKKPVYLLATVLLLLTLSCGCGGGSLSGRNSTMAPTVDNRVTFLGKSIGLVSFKVTANSKELIWGFKRATEDGSTLPDATRYHFDNFAAKWSEAAKKAPTEKSLFRVSGIPEIARNNIVWLTDVRIELATETQDNQSRPPNRF